MKENYPLIDRWKLVMATVVVMIHTRPWQSLGRETIINLCDDVLTYPAVPFFFMTSGFMLFRKMSLPLTKEGSQRIRGYIKKTMKLYAVWSLIYLPVTLYGEIVVFGVSPGKGILKMIRNFLLIGNDYNAWQLWYLHGLLIASLLVWILGRAGFGLRRMLAASALCFLAGIGLDQLGTMQTQIPVLTRVAELYFSILPTTMNGLFRGFFFFVLGGCIAAFDRRISIPATAVAAGCAILFLGMYLECGHIFLFSLTGVAVSLLIFIGAAGRREGGGERELFCRKASMVIYLVHMYFYTVYVDWIGVGKEGSGIDVFLFTYGLSALTAVWMVRKRWWEKKGFLSVLFP